MRRTNLASSAPAVLTLAALAISTLAVLPVSAAPQRSQGGGRPTSSRPAPSGGGGSTRPAPSGGGSSGGGGNGGGSNGGSQPSSAPAPKGEGGATSGTSGTSGNSGGGTTSTTNTPGRPTSGHAPASGATVGRAARPAPGSGTTVVIPNGYYGGFYPWGWAGLGFGGYYGGYYGYYDPWIDGGGYGGYYGQPYTTSGYDDGMLRLKMKPREGVVYVDGFFAGRVDDFDGVFQRLHIEPGAHHIEVTADGYEPLELDVQIQRGRLITYSGELKRIQ